MTSGKRKSTESRASPSASAPWRIHPFSRRVDKNIPAQEFLDALPTAIAAKIIAVLDAVAGAPPPSFSGGGKWEAMHGEMSGIYEVRADGARR
ncbi:MAG TPA: hypothetical protein VF395_22705 [Polyangiaceae bacterium]